MIISKEKFDAMSIDELTKYVEDCYDADNYSPTGADGGCLRYILVRVWHKEEPSPGMPTLLWASITVDSEIAAIRRVWELRKGERGEETLYDFKDEYYSIR